MSDSGKLERLVFRSNSDGSKKEPEKGDRDFTVMINPDAISRKMNMVTTENESGTSQDKGDAFYCGQENISFTFYLDRTNVVPKTQTRHDYQSVNEMIDEFIKVVFKTNNSGVPVPVQALSINYGNLAWTVRTNSITIDHSLFDRNGNTLRAKITCSFQTVKDDKDPPKSNVLECLSICSEARKNDQNTLYSLVKGCEIKV